MIFITALALLLAFAVGLPTGDRQAQTTGCGCSLPNDMLPGLEYNMTFDDDPNRSWLLFIPPEYSTDEPNPVVFSYHGGGRTPERQRELDRLEEPDFNTNHIIVYPRGIEVEVSRLKIADDAQGRWEGTPNITARDDVGYTNGILDWLQESLCIDPDRAFITGKSNGGGFTNFAACHPQLSTRFAAFAPVAGSFYIDGQRGCDPNTVELTCTPGRPDVPVIEFHGGSDGTIAYGGDPDRRGSCLPSVMHWLTEWARRDGLLGDGDEDPAVRELTDRAQVYEWGTEEDCNFGLVTHVFEQDKGHSWPYTSENDDNNEEGNNDGPSSYNATPIILEFFGSHPLH